MFKKSITFLIILSSIYAKYDPSFEIKLNMQGDNKKVIEEKIDNFFQLNINSSNLRNNDIFYRLDRQERESIENSNNLYTKKLKNLYKSLVENENIKRKNFKEEYVTRNNELIELIGEFDSNIQNLVSELSKFRTIKSKISNLKKRISNLNSLKKNKLKNKELEVGKFESNQEAHAIYGVFASSIENKNGDFIETTNKLNDILRSGSIKFLSPSYVEVVKATLYGKHIIDEQKLLKRGMATTTGFDGYTIAYERNSKILTIKEMKFIPSKYSNEDSKKNNLINKDIKVWYITKDNREDFEKYLENLRIKNKANSENIKNSIDILLRNVEMDNKYALSQREDIIKNFNDSINTINDSVSSYDKKIIDYTNERIVLEKEKLDSIENFKKTFQKAKNGLKKIKDKEDEIFNLINIKGYETNVYHSSHFNYNKNPKEAFLNLTKDIVKTIHSKSDIVHETFETIVNGGYFMQEVAFAFKEKRDFIKLDLYFATPYQSSEPSYPIDAIIGAKILMKKPITGKFPTQHENKNIMLNNKLREFNEEIDNIEVVATKRLAKPIKEAPFIIKGEDFLISLELMGSSLVSERIASANGDTPMAIANKYIYKNFIWRLPKKDEIGKILNLLSEKNLKKLTNRKIYVFDENKNKNKFSSIQIEKNGKYSDKIKKLGKFDFAYLILIGEDK